MAKNTKKLSEVKGIARTQKKKVEIPTQMSPDASINFQNEIPGEKNKEPQRKKLLVFLIGIFALLILGFFLIQNGLIVAGVVNGKPLFSWDLYRILMSRFGKQTLEGMISEELIRQEAQKAGIVVPQEEINAKEQEIVKGLGGESSIDELLKFQGITKDDFDRQIKLQLTVGKILQKEATVENKEVDEFIEKNKTALTATEPGTLREEAKKTLMEQKVGEKIQPWFTSLKEKAKIIRFLQ